MDGQTNIMSFSTERLTQRQKDAYGKRYYKDKIDRLMSGLLGNNYTAFSSFATNMNQKIKMQANYDLFNGIVNPDDFKHITQPFGVDGGNMPVNFSHKDILSSKLKVIMGLEIERPFDWSVIATDEEATTRYEKEYYDKLKEAVVGELVKQVRIETEIKYQNLSKEEREQKQQEIENEIQTMTIEQVGHYMKRDYKDIAEVMSEQLLNYLIVKDDILRKFNNGWHHAICSAYEVYWVGIVNGEPTVRNVNPVYFDVFRSPSSALIEDGHAAIAEIHMSPSEVVEMFGSELTDKDIDKIYEYASPASEMSLYTWGYTQQMNQYTIPVRHAEWKGLRKIGFLTYRDADSAEPLEILVDENYELNTELGDISIKWEWITEVHQGFKIGTDIYVGMKPVENQHKDLDNIYTSKLSFKGMIYDAVNSEPVSMIDRVKHLVYLYDIIAFRIEKLIASDKGKILMMNLNAIPNGAGFNTKKFLYYLEANQLGLVNPNQEGMKHSTGNIGEMVKEVDMTMISQISNYINLAEHIEEKIGMTIGVTKPMEGNIKTTDAVTNVRQSLQQSSYIIEPYFYNHQTIKRNVLQALIECAKIAYRNTKKKAIQFALDDLSVAYLNIDGELLDNSTLGIYVANVTKTLKIKQLAEQLAHAAMQNQMLSFNDLLKVYQADSAKQAQELLEIAEEKQKREQQEAAAREQEYKKELLKLENENNEAETERTIKINKAKEEERRETELQKQAMLSIGFNEDKDADGDGQLDVIELLKQGLAERKHIADVQLKTRKLDIEEKKLNKRQ